MHLNTTPDDPPRLPCMRDMHELVHVVLTEPLLMLSPLEELARRLHEVTAHHPRFREEAPLVLAGETRRRRRYSGALTVAHSPATRWWCYTTAKYKPAYWPLLAAQLAFLLRPGECYLGFGIDKLASKTTLYLVTRRNQSYWHL